MKNWIPALGRTFVSIGILAAGVGGFFLMGTPEVPVQPPRPAPPPLVVAKPALAHTDGIAFDVDGVVVPYREIDLTAQISGKVQYKSDACRSGRTVKKGDLLLRIEPDDYQLEVRRLAEELAQAEAMIRELDAEIIASDNQIESSRQQLAIDVRQLKRNEDLMLRSAASDSEVDSARKAELTTRNTLQSQIDQRNLLTQRRLRMESAKALVQANLDKAELNLARTEIKSPIDGVVVSESVEQDGYVQAGGSIVVLQDTSRLDVSCKLYMQQMHWLWQSGSPAGSDDDYQRGYDFPETPATVIYSLGDEQFAWRAVADRYDGAGVDAQTRMVPCRVHVDDPTAVMKLAELESVGRGDALVAAQENSGSGSGEQQASLGEEIIGRGATQQPPTLMTGMFVKVRIHATPPIPLVRLPHEAIQPGNTVWTVQSGKLHKKSIAVANSTADYVVAYQRSGGLRAGDLIVTSPLATPVEGMAVSTSADPSSNKRSGPPGGKPGADGKRRGGSGQGGRSQ
ncbi:efflux RND transporter periplasmic adaptor subunit [Stieleria mannarensis]|uniref:efflux RND transporter periplasmic adaptor subunit n=1 Tax=Stieleria mannarensis TaxID=2755585 RepID=UPI0016004959|nr:HlyD family efflux transporter periplasmic adaptor subunit [Rhodopirellula sp. JC639]